MIASLSRSSFQGTVHGFEINEQAAAIASKRAAENGLQNCYQVLSSFGGPDHFRVVPDVFEL